MFPNAAYKFIGFILGKEEELRAVFQQRFIEGEQADLLDTKEHLGFNGFANTKRQDYINTEFGLILEDMHDENVIARNDVLFFIDTVFYIMEKIISRAGGLHIFQRSAAMRAFFVIT